MQEPQANLDPVEEPGIQVELRGYQDGVAVIEIALVPEIELLKVTVP